MSKVYYNHTIASLPVLMGVANPGSIALKRVGDTYFYGVSVCHEEDNFSREEGRKIAELRMEAGFGSFKVSKRNESLLVPDDAEKDPLTLQRLYNISESLQLNSRKWEQRIADFNAKHPELKDAVQEVLREAAKKSKNGKVKVKQLS